MTFATYKDTPGRQAANVLELDLDYCSRSYGVSPCTADLGLQNGLRWSQEFDQWAKARVTVTVNTTNDPLLGNLVADSLFEVATTGFHTVNTTWSGVDATAIRTGSVYLNGIGRTKVQLHLFNASATLNSVFVEFDLSNQTLTASSVTGDGQFISANIYPEGPDGFYRLIITGIADTLGGVTDGVFMQLRFVNDAGSTSYLGDVTKGFIAFGGQLREGLYPGKYAHTVATAVDGMGNVDNLCFNTFGTCQDTPNFLKQVRTLRFIDTLQRPYEFLDAYPSMVSVRYAPTVIRPGGNLSIRGQVTVVLQDFATTDNELDDYVRERSYDPEDRGTFFGKLKARNVYYIGRPMRVLEGYLDGADLADFRTREYIIDDVSGPTADGRVTITGKDILSLAADVRAKCPTGSTYSLRAAMTLGQTTLLPQTGEAVLMIAGDKHVRVNDEIIELVSESPTDTLNVVRKRGGTDGDAHELDDSIQECKTYEDEPVIDVIDDLLTNFANVPAAFIPTADWEAEEAESLAGYLMETIISEPTGVLSLLKEIAEITLLDIWYDDTAQEIKLKLQTPFTEVTETVTDELDILKDSLRVKDLNNQRLTRVLIYYGIRNFAEKLKDAENFSLINFEIEADKESANKYNDERIKVIYSRWFDATNATQVALTSQRLLDRFGITPKQIQFKLDAKDVERLKTGDVFDLVSRIEQDIDGTKATNRYQVTESKAFKPGSQYSYKADAFFQDPQPDSLIISTDQIDYDLFVELGGPPGPVDVTLTINSAINVDGSNGNDAIITEGMHPDSTLKIINNGNLRGYGGNAGAGGHVTGFFDFEPGLGCLGSANGRDGFNGQVGGDVINTTIDVTIDNTNGNIWAGAGGGAGGGADGTFNDFGGGGGGGGGIGTDTGNAGPGGSSTVTGNGPGCGVTNNNGNPGTAGSTSAAGALGTGGGGGGDGANGGADWGDDGSDGSDGVGAVGGSGGLGGYAVRLNGNSIIWLGGNTAAKVKGDVA